MRNEILNFFEFLIRNLDGRLGKSIRYWYYKNRFAKCGKNVIIEPGVHFQNPEKMVIGDNVWIDRYAVVISGEFVSRGRKFLNKTNPRYKGDPGVLTIGSEVHIAPFVVLQAHGGLAIGRSVTIAAGAKVYTLSHHYRNLSDPADKKRYSFSSMAPIEDQFLIMAPVVIEDFCAVGLNSVVLPGTTLRSGTWLGVLTHLPPGETEVSGLYSGGKASKKLE